MMRFIEFLILFFGLLGMSCEATDGTSSTIDSEAVTRRCIEIFGKPKCPVLTPAQKLPTPTPSCRCVPSYQCTQKNSIIITADLQGRDQNNRNTECVDSDEICCDTRDINDTITNTKPKPVFRWKKFWGIIPYFARDLPPVVSWDCTCVPYYRCSLNETDVEHTDDSCPNSLDICCPNSSIINKTETTSPTPTLVVPKHLSRSFRFRNPDEDNVAEFGEFPWMIAVIGRSYGMFYECGGSLIHPRAVLTAAHTTQKYVGKPGDLLVRAGEWDVRSEIEPLVHQDREVEIVIIHENFNPGDLRNDFAILILKTEFEIAPHINTIHLPQPSENFEVVRCVASGWGKNKYGNQGSFQHILKKVSLPVVPSDVCQRSLSSTSLRHDFVLHPSFICAGGEPGKAMCTGDGGSPLVCPSRNDQSKYVQVGIVSWGIGCGQYRVPGVYSSVSNARQWIDNKLALFNLNARQKTNFIPLSPENIF